MRRILVSTLALVLTSSLAEARVVRLRIERREVVLNGRAFGAAGPYEKLIGKVDFGLDPDLPRNSDIVDLKLAPRNARGEVESSADFYMLKPVNPGRGDGRIFYEVGNRGNEDEQGRRVFDGVFDQVGGAGRGSFNHRFGQASRDALQYFNILFPVDLFPFTDGPETDPVGGAVDSLLGRAERTGTAPKIFHLLTNSEYFNRAGSLVHTDPTGTKDADLPANTRVYMIASAPHGPGPFPPASNVGGGMVGRAALNPLNYSPALRALFRALDRWVVEDVTPPPSAYPRIADGTLTTPDRAGWPAIPGFQLPRQPLRAFHLNFGPDWAKGIVSVEPPEVGAPFAVRVPAVDADGNVRSGIRLPDIAVPLATQAGWNYRDASIGAPDRLAGEIGSYIPLPRTKADRERANDPRVSIEERYSNRDEYVGKFAAATLDLVARGYVLADDVADLLKHAVEHYDWATKTR